MLSAIAEAVGASAGGAMLSGRIFAGYRTRWPRPSATPASPGWPRAGRAPVGATPRVFQLTLKEFADDLAVLSRERFGPAGLVITYRRSRTCCRSSARWPATWSAGVDVDTESGEDVDLARQVVTVLERVAGRVVCNGWPTGVTVVAAQNHGGPWPATTAPAYTSVRTAAIRRWLVPVAYQDFPPGSAARASVTPSPVATVVP